MIYDESVDHARSFLGEHNFDVDAIPLGRSGTTIFRARTDRDEYILDANSLADWSFIMNDVGGDERRALSWKCLSQVVMGARDRLLAAKSSRQNDFKILWRAVSIAGFAGQLEASFYGVEHLCLYPSRKFVDCYHFNRNLFEVCPEIDAAVLCTPGDRRLLINYFSPNRVRFRQSRLYSLLESRVIDPERDARHGRALIIGSGGARDTSGTIQREYLNDRGIMFAPCTEVRLGE